MIFVWKCNYNRNQYSLYGVPSDNAWKSSKMEMESVNWQTCRIVYFLKGNLVRKPLSEQSHEQLWKIRSISRWIRTMETWAELSKYIPNINVWFITPPKQYAKINSTDHDKCCTTNKVDNWNNTNAVTTHLKFASIPNNSFICGYFSVTNSIVREACNTICICMNIAANSFISTWMVEHWWIIIRMFDIYFEVVLAGAEMLKLSVIEWKIWVGVCALNF